MTRVHYSEFEVSSGIVLRHGLCPAGHVPTPEPGHAVALLPSQPGLQRITCDSVDAQGRAINPAIADLSPAEIEARRKQRPGPISRPARITQADWEALHARLEALERKRP
jgi:hypothetical protein